MSLIIIFILAAALEIVIVYDRAEINPNKAMLITMVYAAIAAIIVIYYVDNHLMIVADIIGSGVGRNIGARLVRRGNGSQATPSQSE